MDFFIGHFELRFGARFLKHLPIELDFLGVDDVTQETERFPLTVITRSPMQHAGEVIP